MEEAAWIYHFANDEDEDFRPDLSLLMRIGVQSVAYTVCHVEKDRNGELRIEPWITQMGVRQGFRRRGLASKLLGENLHRMINAGYSKAKLSVNTNNNGANKLYKQVGFETLKTFTMYAKTISI
jgi:ribosomal protein S18 acetylase RimI-like enzyme